MPEIKLKHVVSCSSEDSTHKAENLLNSDTYRKWKAARPGEKQISVILQFEKEEHIHSIDIGNEGSAFIEVLVGHSTSIKDQDYEVLLVTSSFMSPSESRNGTNSNRVRLFGPNQLVKATAQEKWDRVKIICMQPYSKNIAYGVAFVKFHSPPDKSDPPAATPPLTKLGQFRVKEEAPSTSPSLQPGSLFLSRDSAPKLSASPKVSPQKEKLSYAAAALQSGSGGSQPQPTGSNISSVQTSAKRKFEFSKEHHSGSSQPLAKKASTVATTEPGGGVPKQRPKQTSAGNSGLNKSTSEQKNLELSEKRESPARLQSRTKVQNKPSEVVSVKKILEGVVVVLSGFQNPFRGELRDKALSMGARYRPDWTPDATHLICAFANTPKYSQVKAAGGTIVRKEWVLDCYKRKQKISYKRYLMDGAESSSEESSGEKDESEEEQVKGSMQKERKQTTPRKSDQEGKAENEYAGSTDADEPGNEDSGMDTEDELKRAKGESLQRRDEREARETTGGRNADVYGGSTDENTDAEAEEDKPIPELPDFLTGKRFFLFGKFSQNERRLLLRCIIAFNGVVEEYMSDKVQFVITAEGWHSSFEEALIENCSLCFVKPTWIFAINDRQKMLPYQPYTVVP
ncbi:DNA repair protein XRCC1-like [Brienomyrus brachyistius]|uniref:DNA repair protein XRCC1-like n=1 Tax=Brienomyrus brachyistius TaxID=42636 RepID=UPI0020B403FD|nr:DNA repair protein XRCC1-like [Brienomyrus brachyistius]XP_048880783.1 DNA repair protein XRCC1-like [Brienomyrus brachyistius]